MLFGFTVRHGPDVSHSTTAPAPTITEPAPVKNDNIKNQKLRGDGKVVFSIDAALSKLTNNKHKDIIAYICHFFIVP
jgi:hypothetical protein